MIRQTYLYPATGFSHYRREFNPSAPKWCTCSRGLMKVAAHPESEFGLCWDCTMDVYREAQGEAIVNQDHEGMRFNTGKMLEWER